MANVNLISIEDFKPTETGLYLIKYMHDHPFKKNVPGYISVAVTVHKDNSFSIDFNTKDREIILISDKPIYVNPYGFINNT
jgi:hypothetical protein